MKFKSRRLSVEHLDSRVLLAADVATLLEAPHGHDAVRACFAEDVAEFYSNTSARIPRQAAANKDFWPDQITLPMGLEPEGITAGKGQEFFVGGFSFSSVFGPLFEIEYPVSQQAGAIYKGNLRTGQVEILVDATGIPASGMSYDPRTDLLYVATQESNVFPEPSTNAGVTIYNGTTGAVVKSIVFGNGIVVNDVLVTNKAVFVTDSLSTNLYKISLNNGGQPSSDWDTIDMGEAFDMDMVRDDYNANGLVGSFDGKDLVVVNVASGGLYHVDTESGFTERISITGEETEFVFGDGLYLDGRTLYIMQNQAGSNESGKIAVVQLSGDLSEGTFVKNIQSYDFAIATSIIGHGDSIYAVNTGFVDAVFGDPLTVQTQVVKVKK